MKGLLSAGQAKMFMVRSHSVGERKLTDTVAQEQLLQVVLLWDRESQEDAVTVLENTLRVQEKTSHKACCGPQFNVRPFMTYGMPWHKLQTGGILIFAWLFAAQTDVPDSSLGTVHSQKTEGEEHPILFQSWKLQPSKTRFATIEEELWAAEALQGYLVHSSFPLITPLSSGSVEQRITLRG
uniref:Uncharacterized protein n=1 Tax=Sphaerodactylus townsendi TaxID=933632 RepID=A0ACB8EYA7_9SAUR